MIFFKCAVESLYVMIPGKPAHAGYRVSFSEELAALSHTASGQELVGGAACLFFKPLDKMLAMGSNNNNTRVGSGGYGYTEGLPAPEGLDRNASTKLDG